ncbi:hypothetical protein L873DRAFT_263120 [Choiromyces venosus 120613-1]|uniref:Uncharacterized protein n=1 Tax=Choiromyces venosus 120613-1 TaxID=1336337 RepID=A0A3N4J142_9PEZI|nr:hypothetical protein L873DRAFT_263120 [Choiromyces venosus 120613-1]
MVGIILSKGRVTLVLFSICLKRTYMEDELSTAGVEEWNAIKQDKINELVETMPQYMEAVI